MSPSPDSASPQGRPLPQPERGFDRGWRHRWRLFAQFLRRELGERFLGSFSGGLWALLQPLIQLAIYSFVFVHIFKARGPGDVAYVPFLAVALWPWAAFSEALQRATTSIVENSALIGKVAMPRAIPVLASVTGSFLIHSAGFVAVLVALPLFGYPIQLLGIVPAIGMMALLLLAAIGMGLALAALQVFVRDLVQVVTQLLTLLMFAAPIFYARDMIPKQFQWAIELHPYTWYATGFRSLLLEGNMPWEGAAMAIALVIAILGGGWWLFHRLDRHFEDFL